MKCILLDLRRAIAGRWFLAALIATTAALYLSIGQATYSLIDYLESIEWQEDNFWYSLSDLLILGMQGDFGVLTLPALSALPFAAQALHEIKSGAIRPAVFRTGRTAWIVGKAASCTLSGMVLQGAAVGIHYISPLCSLYYIAETMNGSRRMGVCNIFHKLRMKITPRWHDHFQHKH